MNKYLYIMLIPFLALVSCNKEDVTKFDTNERYLYIPNEDKVNELLTTFKFFPDQEDVDVLFDVNLVGSALVEDQAYAVVVVDTSTTAPKENYTVEKLQMFHAGKYTDQLKITLHKTALLDDKEVKVTVRLEPNENFGLAEYMTSASRQSLTAVVTFSNKYIKPLWWDENIVNNYLGKFDEKGIKYQYFIEFCDGEILDLTDMSADDRFILARNFKKYLTENDLRDENGNPMADSIPVF
ncbi:MAG: DUF4843 domain-containing protein [Bacteroides sp.]|uniref:DUF4843 domain-containing protein n=1 Tax=Bacteroides xylanisolvens TaxID=371601 RepID=UPI0023077A38|nr:DUF4843 domain-containing protein [Bacteroides xylanisolvens]MBE5694426.1 DUF4843 domain-containing protein [Bacteroides sp.]MDB0714764.1 DUF4843 domain-containing protein [Bacteroides xylanisolvens]MDB0734454.1 DUF4843 domain-containing protein [Bacteroides xylanisolvens]